MSLPINYGGPAFPVTNPAIHDAHGMTLRDYFAAKALAGVMANVELSESLVKAGGIARADALAARVAYDLADAMLAAREAK